jgi:alkyl hydroperoxide reductase subunit AhpC
LYKGKGVEIIGINCDGPRSISKVAPLSKSLQIQYPVLLDINSELKSELNILVFPTLIMVNSKGKIVWIHEGFVSGDTEIIISEIEKQLKEN